MLDPRKINAYWFDRRVFQKTEFLSLMKLYGFETGDEAPPIKLYFEDGRVRVTQEVVAE